MTPTPIRLTRTAPAAQGDLLLIPIAAPPTGLAEVAPTTRAVLAHSETGHDHVLTGNLCHYRTPDDLVSYVHVIGDKDAELVHHRTWDTHATLTLPGGWYVCRRQREYTPQGWRRVED